MEKSRAWWEVLAISALGRLGQADSRGSLASQLCLWWAPGQWDLRHKIKWRTLEEGFSRLTSGLYTHVCVSLPLPQPQNFTLSMVKCACFEARGGHKYFVGHWLARAAYLSSSRPGRVPAFKNGEVSEHTWGCPPAFCPCKYEHMHPWPHAHTHTHNHYKLCRLM